MTLVGQLLGQGPNVDWRAADDWWTALHHAANGGHTPVVTLLLDAGWSLEARNDRGSTPLNLAAEVGHNETVNTVQV